MGNEESHFELEFNDGFGNGATYDVHSGETQSTGGGLFAALLTTGISIGASMIAESQQERAREAQREEQRRNEQRIREAEKRRRREREARQLEIQRQRENRERAKRNAVAKKRELIKTLTQELQIHRQSLVAQTENVNQIQSQYYSIRNKYENELSSIIYEDSKNIVANDMVIAVVGETGNGKSTLCNRLFGDESKEGDKGPFEVSEMDVGTLNVNFKRKWVSIGNNKNANIVIVDTPGLNDGTDNNNKYLNNIGDLVKTCHHINAFFIVIKYSDMSMRYRSTKRAIKSFEQLLSKKMYQHLILVITRVEGNNSCDNNGYLLSKSVSRKINKLKSSLFDDVNICNNVELVTIGHNDYKNKVKKLLSMVKNNAFNGKEIVTRPIDILQRKLDAVQNTLSDAQNSQAIAEQKMKKTKSKLKKAESELTRLQR